MNLANLMQGMGPNLLNAVGQGVLWGIMVLGVYITFRLLDIADLIVGGSSVLGGCVCATLIVDRGMNPVAALAIAILAGMAADFVTGVFHTAFEIPSILAGIPTQVSLWSINLWITGGDSSIPLLRSKTIVTTVFSSTGLNQAQASQVIGTAAVILMVAVIYWFFGMGIGSALETTRDNEDMIRVLGVNTKWTKLLALMLSNGLVDMSGALVCQGQKHVDIQMSIGVIVISLAVIVIGEALFGWFCNFALKLSAAVVGSVICSAIRAFVIKMGMNPNYTKLLPAIVVTLVLYIPVAANKWRIYREYSEGGNIQC